MSNPLPANRVAALGSFGVSLGSLVAAFQGVFPHSWQNLVLGAVGVLSHSPVVVTYLLGSQKWDALQATPPAAPEQLDSSAWLDARALPEVAPEPAPAPAPVPPAPAPVAPAPVPPVQQ